MLVAANPHAMRVGVKLEVAEAQRTARRCRPPGGA